MIRLIIEDLNNIITGLQEKKDYKRNMLQNYYKALALDKKKFKDEYNKSLDTTIKDLEESIAETTGQLYEAQYILDMIWKRVEGK